MHRFYLPALFTETGTLVITDPAEIHHIKDVLRLKAGDRVCVFDGAGVEAEGPITGVDGAGVHVLVEVRRAAEARARGKVVLACAIPKRSKFEDIIEKVTELGVDEIIPLLTARTEVRVEDAARAQRKTERFLLKAVGAAKQCQRATVPVIHPPTPLADVLKTLTPDDLVVMPCLIGARKPLRDILTASANRLIFLIGPEGDFTPEEVRAALEAGCVPASLGPTVLKVDTAAITVAAAANLLLK